MNKELEPGIEELEGRTLVITHMSRKQFEKETLEELEKLEEGEETVSKKVFEDPRELAKLFTEKRHELLREVRENPPESISQLSKNLERNSSDVHSDLELLEKHGIIFFKEEGKARKPRVPYKEVRVEFNLLDEKPDFGEAVEAKFEN